MPDRAGEGDAGSGYRIAIIAGEASGDLLGAALVDDLLAAGLSLNLSGVGGPRLAERGQYSIVPMDDLSIIGLMEALAGAPRVLRHLKTLTRTFRDNPPDILITIDLPDFNFMLAKRVRAMGFPIVQYVSPQVWAWRQGRAKRMHRLFDHVMALYPFEPPFFAAAKLPATFVGHPLVKQVSPSGDRLALRRELGVKREDTPVVTFMPGSRPAEISRMMPVILAAGRMLRERLPRVRFLMAKAPNLDDAIFEPFIQQMVALRLSSHEGRNRDLLEAADAAIITSGTATLEGALVGVPMVVAYRVNALTYHLGRHLIKTEWISLVNLIAGREIVTERVQQAASAPQLADDVYRLLTDNRANRALRDELANVRHRLNTPDQSAAQVVHSFLENRSIAE